MTRKAAGKDRKSRQRSDGAVQAIDDESFYALRVNITGAPVVLFPFSKDLFLKVSDKPSLCHHLADSEYACACELSGDLAIKTGM